jgi:hypothetical protein
VVVVMKDGSLSGHAELSGVLPSEDQVSDR